ncbi:hypothetical protein DOY81_012772, partial [Sarcophaga bullata]
CLNLLFSLPALPLLLSPPLLL